MDPSTRLITLRDEQGSTSTLHAGPEVRNFAQIEAGDSVNLRYVESLARPGVAVAAARAPSTTEVPF